MNIVEKFTNEKTTMVPKIEKIIWEMYEAPIGTSVPVIYKDRSYELVKREEEVFYCDYLELMFNGKPIFETFCTGTTEETAREIFTKMFAHTETAYAWNAAWNF